MLIKQCVLLFVLLLGLLEAISAQEIQSPKEGSLSVPGHAVSDTELGNSVESKNAMQSARSTQENPADRDTSTRNKYKKKLLIALIVGTVGATWYTLRQRSFGKSAPGSSCLELFSIIAMILYGMISSITSIYGLIFR